jgi:hypothetical protein
VGAMRDIGALVSGRTWPPRWGLRGCAPGRVLLVSNIHSLYVLLACQRRIDASRICPGLDLLGTHKRIWAWMSLLSFLRGAVCKNWRRSSLHSHSFGRAPQWRWLSELAL